MKIIAVASHDQAADRIADSVNRTLAQKYKSLLAQTSFSVSAVHDRHSSSLKTIQDIPEDKMVILIDLHDHTGKSLLVVAAIPRNLAEIGDHDVVTDIYLIHDNKTDRATLEPRIIKMRGIEYAIATLVSRYGSRYIDFGDN